MQVAYLLKLVGCFSHIKICFHVMFPKKKIIINKEGPSNTKQSESWLTQKLPSVACFLSMCLECLQSYLVLLVSNQCI